MAAPDPLGRKPVEAEVARWLVAGGDERIRLQGDGRNQYGCLPQPEVCDAAFSSCTASTISPGAFAAACERLEALRAQPGERQACRLGAAQVRQRLAAFCGMASADAEAIVLAASGTDLHLIAAELARGEGAGRLISLVPDPAETGRGVPNALRGLHYGAAPPYGAPSRVGEPMDPAGRCELMTVPLRRPDGVLRQAQAVDEAFEAAAQTAFDSSARILLVLLDVSKTGLLAPTPDCALRLKRRFGERLTVLVDACQFRLSTESIRRYRGAGFMVAVTGSKFLGGPAFCGALLLPGDSAARLQGAALSPALADYSARSDWPEAFAARALLPDAPNLGLLLRWEAALHELDAFQRLPAADVERILGRVGAAVAARLRAPDFEALPGGSGLESRGEGWDARPSLFPFLARAGGRLLSAEQTRDLHRRLSRPDPSGVGLGSGRVLLGQPVAVGRRGQQPISALRLAISAGQIVAAAAEDDGAERLALAARQALDRVAACAASLA